MKTVAIIGLGLIGGSLGMALRRSKKYRVIGIGRNAARLREAKRLGAADVVSTKLTDAASADIVVICSPVDAVVPLFRRLVPHLKSGAVVTDVGSVKQSIVAAAARVKRAANIYFVGGHPLAGSYKTGVKAAHFRLFEGSTVVLVPGPRGALQALKSLWNAAGARVQIMNAKAHDRAVALISHLPHAAAHALTHAFLRRADRRTIAPLLAGSFRDMTRVAAADADQWAQILRANARDVAAALRDFRRELTHLEKNLTRSRLKRHLKTSQACRRSLFNGS